MDKDELLNKIISEKGGTKEQYLSLMNKIAYHESAHTMDPSIKQMGGGPGRGKYQFEEGKHRGGITAARRTKKYLDSIGEKSPEWLNEALQGNSLDATQLSSDQQDILFLGNMRMHPKADFSNYIEGKESPEEFWANYHWAGGAKDRAKRLNSFNKSMNKYNQELGIEPEESNFNYATEDVNTQPIDNTAVAGLQIDYSRMRPTEQPQPSDYSGLLPPTVNTQEQPQEQVQQPQEQPQQGESQDLLSYLSSLEQQKNLNTFDGGGTHQENPNGGIPQGTGPNGKPNTVEEGETSFNFGDDKFIFSNRISLTDYVNQKNNNKTNQFATGGKLNGSGDPTDPPEDEVKDYYEKYMSSAGYKNKLISSGYEFPNSVANERLNNIKNTKVSYQDKEPGFIGQLKNMVTDTPYTTVGSIYKPTDRRVIMDNEQTNSIGHNYPELAKKEVLAHELNHAASDRKTNGVYGTNLNKRDAKQLYDRLQGKQGRNRHELDPEERHSDLNAFRFYLHNQGLFDPTSNKKFTKKDLDKALEYSPGSYNFSRLLRDYKEDDLIWLMNNVASTDQKNKNKNIV